MGNEDLVVAEEKVNHLSNVKSKLEQTLDELEDSHAKEKRSRADVEKRRRQVEGDLRITQETVNDLEKMKKELESSIARLEKEGSQMGSKLDNEQTIVSRFQK